MRSMSITEEFEVSAVDFMTEFYKDGKLLVREMNSADTIAFNVWSLLTHTKPKGMFDEVRIRVATDAEVEEWNEPVECRHDG